MRIRSIKPEFWRSDDTDQLDWSTRLVFIGLWSYVDDNGVGLYKLPSIVADLFANDFSLDPIETLNRVSTALDALESRQMITRYSVGNKAYVYVFNWVKHQRVNNPNKPRFPLPTCENSEPLEGLGNSYVDPIGTLPPGAGEQGSRGTGEQGTLCPPPAGDRFDDFWAAYPRKVGKSEARRKFAKALEMDPDLDPQVLVDAATRYANDPNRTEKFTRYPATWLHQGNWEDSESLFADETSGSKTSDWDDV